MINSYDLVIKLLYIENPSYLIFFIKKYIFFLVLFESIKQHWINKTNLKKEKEQFPVL